MSEEKFRILAQYRLAQAREAIREARVLYERGLIYGATNRAYYAMFYAVQALMVKSDVFTSKHRGVISYFDLEFVKTGKIGKSFSKWLHDAFDYRLDADYGKREKVMKETAHETIEHAQDFIREIERAVEDYLSSAQ